MSIVRKHRFGILVSKLIFVLVLSFSAVSVHAQATPQGLTASSVETCYNYSVGGGNCLDPSNVFPSGIRAVAQVFGYTNASANQELEIQWYRNGAPVTEPSSNILVAGNGWFASALTNPNGLQEGNWEVRYRANGQAIASLSFTITGRPFICCIVFGHNIAIPSYNIIDQEVAFPAGATEVYASYQFYNFPTGSVITIETYRNNVMEYTYQVDTSGSGNGWYRLTNPSGNATGTYQMVLKYDGQMLASGIFTVGTSGQPVAPISLTATPALTNTISVQVPQERTDALNVRSGPSTDCTVIGSLVSGQSAPLLGRNQDNSWLYVQLPNGVTAWVFANLVELPSSVDLTTVNVVNNSSC